MSIVTENALTGEEAMWYTIGGAGDITNVGFCRELSVNVGETAHFSCVGAGTIIDIYRIGWYGGLGWRKVTTITNTPATQPDAAVVPNTNGGTTCTAWSVTASWAVPANATSGLYVGVFRSVPGPNASWIPFIVRDDALVADIIYKTSDATWGLAYNHYGTFASPFNGKNVYGIGGIGQITDRTSFTTYHKPIVTRQGVPQTYWYACEYPMIRWLERNGYNVKYVTCKDLDQRPGLLDKGKVFMSCGHDEYWSQPMRDAVVTWRDQKAGRSIFASANEVFWRTRYVNGGTDMLCYKDTMQGPGGHSPGVPLDPVSWTGTWKDERWGGNQPEWTLTGTDFRMNGVVEYDAIITPAYSTHPVWDNTAAQLGSTTLSKVIGFEADSVRATQPPQSVKVLASTPVNINGRYADNNGQNYDGNGTLDWGIISQRYQGGGLTVGLGTCEWSWALDATHDRGPTIESPTAQQFMINLLLDLGASPNSLQSPLVLRTAVDLDEYGLIPGTFTVGSDSNIVNAAGVKLGLKTLVGLALKVGTASKPVQPPIPWLSGASGAGTANAVFGTWRGSSLGMVAAWVNDPELYPFADPANGEDYGEYWDWAGPVDLAIVPPTWTSWAHEASGGHDSFWNAIGTQLATLRGGKGTTYVRIYYEANGDWMPYSVPAGQEGNFRTAFIRTANILKTRFPACKVYLGSAAGGPIAVSSLWPASGVDGLSIDFYNNYPWVTNQAGFDAKIASGAGVNSLEPLRQLAQSKGVPVIISEWGNISTVLPPVAGGGGDAPGFFTAFRSWLAAHAGTGPGQVLGEIYFNVTEGYTADFWLLDINGNVNPKQPLSAAQYKSLW